MASAKPLQSILFRLDRAFGLVEEAPNSGLAKSFAPKIAALLKNLGLEAKKGSWLSDYLNDLCDRPEVMANEIRYHLNLIQGPAEAFANTTEAPAYLLKARRRAVEHGFNAAEMVICESQNPMGLPKVLDLMEHQEAVSVVRSFSAQGPGKGLGEQERPNPIGGPVHPVVRAHQNNVIDFASARIMRRVRVPSWDF